MSKKFGVVTGGYAVSWAPTFATRAEAEAWISRIGEDGGWEERTEAILLEGEEWAGQCSGCGDWAYLTQYAANPEPYSLCEACDAL